MKTLNDFFYDSENRRGFMEAFEAVDGEKLTDLIGEHTDSDVRRYDLYVKSKIGFLNVSPLMEAIVRDIETNGQLMVKTNSALSIQEEAVRVFLVLRFSELLKVKNILMADISVDNGVVRTEDKNTVSNSRNSVSSFNSDDLEDDNENRYSNDTDNTITEKRNDAGATIRNITLLTDFYKQSMVDRIIDFLKDLFTLQIVD